jgi:hypothetical protein
VVLAEAGDVGGIEVRVQRIVQKLETFADILASGDKKLILDYLATKNLYNPQQFKF